MIESEEELPKAEQRYELIKLLNDIRYLWARLMAGVRAYLGFRFVGSLDEIEIFNKQMTKLSKQIQKQFGDKLTFEQEDYMEKLVPLHRQATHQFPGNYKVTQK